MKKQYYIFFISFSLFQFSCKRSEWFDVKSDIKLTVPASLQDFEYLMDDDLVMNLETSGLAEVGSDGHFIREKSFAPPEEINAYTWTKKLPNLVVSDWNLSYKRIFQCNLVLDGLKKLKINSKQEQDRFDMLKGNALFHRAKNYYDLAQIYAQPYKASSASSDLGIPLKEGIDIIEQAKRSSVQETYERIIADLLSASELLPKLALLPTRGSKTSAFALLARTYLTMQEYEKARIYADSSLNLYNVLIDFNSISSTAPNMGLFNAETIFFARNAAWISTWFPGLVFVERDLYDLYENDDLRKTRFFVISGNNISFKGNYNDNELCFNGLATDEQYLIKAECNARAGNISVAMKALNDLRRKRWNNAIVYRESIANDADDALRQVLTERRRELLFRNLRWSDLRRLNLDDRFKITITRTLEGQTYTLEPDSYKYTLPIPDDVISLSGIPQSPGWTN